MFFSYLFFFVLRVHMKLPNWKAQWEGNKIHPETRQRERHSSNSLIFTVINQKTFLRLKIWKFILCNLSKVVRNWMMDLFNNNLSHNSCNSPLTAWKRRFSNRIIKLHRSTGETLFAFLLCYFLRYVIWELGHFPGHIVERAHQQSLGLSLQVFWPKNKIALWNSL